jgi:transcriptional regulator with XRE-family HTH domain
LQDRIKLLRKELGLTQQEFADKIGLKRNSVASYEIGRNTPMDAVILSICREFNVNEEWLRTGQGEMFRELDREDEITKWLGSLMRPDNDNEFIKKFIHMLSRLSIEDWKVLEKMALMMLDDKEKSQA